MSGGTFCISRKIWSHPAFREEPFTEREAFMWMVGEAAWKTHERRIGHGTVTLQRGQLAGSVRFMGEAWGWSKSRVSRFLLRLKNRDMVNYESGTVTLTITICNYNEYQMQPQESGTATGQPAGQQRDSCGTNENKGNTSETIVSDTADVKARVWALGVKVLTAEGVRRPRPLLGKWISEHGEAEVMSALLASDGKADRVAWITARLKRSNRREVTTDEYLARQGIRDVTDDERNFSRGGDTGPPPLRHPANDMPGVQPDAEEEARPVSERDVQAGRGGLALLALRA